MTIRLQNLLVIPPIFFLLGLTVAILADRAAREEIRWGLEEEAEALAVTLAEMVGGADLDRLAGGDATTRARVLGGLDRVARHGQARSVVLYSRALDGPVLAWHRDSTAVALEREVWTSGLRDRRTHGVLAEPGPWGPYPEVLLAGAPIHAAAGGAGVRGAVAVAVDATRLFSTTAEVRRTFGILLLVVTGVGVAAALFLSGRIGRQVRQLRDMGATVAAGEYRAAVEVVGVKEVQDLSNTLGTMASILSDVLSRGRRTLLVGDAFKLSRGVGSTYRAERADAGPVPEGFEVGVGAVGEPSPGSFHGWTRTADHVVFWVGVVEAEEGLERAVLGAAANRALQGAFQKGAPEDVAREVVAPLELSVFQAVWFPLGQGDGPRAQSSKGSGSPVESHGRVVLHTFAAGQMDSIVGTLALFRDFSPRDAVREMPLGLPEDFSGVLLIVRRATRRSPGGPS